MSVPSRWMGMSTASNRRGRTESWHMYSTRPAAPLPAVADHPAYQAYLLLYAGFVVLPIVAGLDKFFHVTCRLGHAPCPAGFASRAPHRPHVHAHGRRH